MSSTAIVIHKITKLRAMHLTFIAESRRAATYLKSVLEGGTRLLYADPRSYPAPISSYLFVRAPLIGMSTFASNTALLESEWWVIGMCTCPHEEGSGRARGES
jgi:hypothetical protein